jgi:hypothetical protein
MHSIGSCRRLMIDGADVSDRCLELGDCWDAWRDRRSRAFRLRHLVGKPLACLALCVTLLICGACEPPLDHGRCLRPRIERYHTDARYEYACPLVLGFDGELHLDCGMHWQCARDWTETFCDAWEFPNGKAEKSP